MTQVAIIDYGMGNRRSVQKGLERAGARAPVSADHSVLRAADGLVLPGVGAFPAAMANLRASGLDQLVIERVGAGVPLLGICLGMQLLFDTSEELEPTPGLGLIPGHVNWLAAADLRIPHIGWNEVTFERRWPLLDVGPSERRAFYHVHSLVARPLEPADVVGTCDYGERFASVVARGNVCGVQFHPEKSSGNGLRLLAGFIALCQERSAPPAQPAAA